MGRFSDTNLAQVLCACGGFLFIDEGGIQHNYNLRCAKCDSFFELELRHGRPLLRYTVEEPTIAVSTQGSGGEGLHVKV